LLRTQAEWPWRTPRLARLVRAYAISLTGGDDRWQSGKEHTSLDGEPITNADLLISA